MGAAVSLLIGIAGTTLATHERAWLADRRVAGLILFSRNFTDPAQLRALVADVRSVRRRLLLCVDQEGGRVQRLAQGFTPLPALAAIGQLYAADRTAGRAACLLHAWIMATEVLAYDIDLSLAPVADLGFGNAAIGDRAFSAAPQDCAELTALYVDRMWRCGMAATLKHFPGHGAAGPDSHHEAVVDPRALGELARTDLLPFAAGIAAGAHAVMTAHISYPQVDAAAAGYSKRWIGKILRGMLRFRGVVMGDDVSMAGAAAAGSIAERVRAHYRAGCDLVLACQPDAVPEALSVQPQPRLKGTHQRLLKARDPKWARHLLEGEEFAERVHRLKELLS